MRRGWIAGGVAGLVFVATPAIAVAVAVAGGAGSDSPAAAPLRPAAEGDADPGEETGPDEGAGPPAWAKDKERPDKAKAKAKAGRERGHQGRDTAWKQAWRKLTPAQRAQRMTDLAKAHAEGMRAFGACADAAGDDAAERRACTKPLPPGLAKKRS
jgi:hypothetical protein